MTIREAFVAAFGSVPNNATCHMYFECGTRCGYPVPAICWLGENPEDPNSMFTCKFIDKITGCLVDEQWSDGWIAEAEEIKSLSVDISDRMASEFRGFFGARYDKVVLDAN